MSYKAEIIITGETRYHIEAETPEELEAAVADEVIRSVTQEEFQRGLRNELYYDYNSRYEIRPGAFWKDYNDTGTSTETNE